MLLQNCPFVGQLIIYCKGQKISRIATLQDSSRDPARHSESAGSIAATSCTETSTGCFLSTLRRHVVAGCGRPVDDPAQQEQRPAGGPVDHARADRSGNVDRQTRPQGQLFTIMQAYRENRPFDLGVIIIIM